MKENDNKKQDDISPPSLKNFGLTFAAVFALIGLIHVPFGGSTRPWALLVSVLFLVTTFTVPQVLSPFNKAWFAFGMLLHRIVNPIVMGIIYFGMLVPMAFIMRSFGKQFLSLKLQADAQSYWIEREPPGPEADSIRNQF